MDPFIIPCEFLCPPPGDHLTKTLYIKHIEIEGCEAISFKYIKLSSCLFVDYLTKTEGQQAVDRLLSVSFKLPVNENRQDRHSSLHRRQTLPRHSHRFHARQNHLWSSSNERYLDHFLARQNHLWSSLNESPYEREKTSDIKYQEILQILRRGIHCSGSIFRFLGHSNSQLKDKTCYMFNATHEEIHDLLSRFADFSNTKGLAKRAKRIGLLFSSFKRGLSLREEEYTVIKDVKENRFLLPETYSRYTFTDGCGLMSQAFAEEVRQTHKLLHTPGVIQIRYQGFKGILLLEPQLLDHKVHFRQSMKKFKVPDENMRRSCNTLGVVEYSRPYSNGYLNTQITMLLADAGVSHDYLQQLQEEFYDVLKLFPFDYERAEIYLRWTGRLSQLERLHMRGMTEKIKAELKKLQSTELDKMTRDVRENRLNEQGKPNKGKLRVLVPKSRVVFGVCDPYEYLGYGECFFQPTLNENESTEFAKATCVVVTRNPCYHPGDIRVLRLERSAGPLSHLYDCIVFPVQGHRPHADECSGGDLDGDKFFVTWDNNLIPRWRMTPFEYTSDPIKAIPSNTLRSIGSFIAQPKQSFLRWGRCNIPRVFGTPEEEEQKRKIRERDQLMSYFATNSNDLVARVDAIFMKYAKLFGPSCDECLELNQFFSDAVDMVADGNQVIAKLQELEHRHNCLTRNQPVPVRPQSILSMFFGEGKPPFRPGDDIWTRMEERARIFVIDVNSH